MFKVPCLDCGALVLGRNRCDIHYRQYIIKYEARRNREHYAGSYKTRARKIKQSARVCWICLEPFKNRNEITADHYFPGQIDSPLLPAHLSCNSSRQDTPPSATGIQ